MLSRGYSYSHKGDYDNALKDFSKTIELKPELQLGLQSFVDKIASRNKAIKGFSKEIKNNPGNTNAYSGRAGVYDDAGLNDKAIEDYSKVIAIKPDDTTAYYNLGIVYWRKGISSAAVKDYNKAIDNFTKALYLKPDYLEVYSFLADTHDRKGDYNKAIENYSRLIELEPDYYLHYYMRGAAYYRKGETDTAIADFSRAIELKQGYYIAYYSRGKAYYKKGEADKAVSDFSKAIEYRGGFTHIRFDFKKNRKEIADTAKAKEILDLSRAIKLTPDFYGAYYFRGNVYYEDGVYEKALSDVNTAIKLKPELQPDLQPVIDAMEKQLGVPLSE